MNSVIAIVSGGMDSVTLAYKLRNERPDGQLVLLSFDYGQRHVRELECATAASEQLSAEHHIVRLPALGHMGGSALTDLSVEIPEGHYADDNMKITVVPNRNMVMLSLGIALAVKYNADVLATGVHAGDHAVYPDCRPQFIDAMTTSARIANEGFIDPNFKVDAPFVNVPKDEIARIGESLGVPWANTWSCYKGGAVHCGKCGTCVERIEAFELAGIIDPTAYEGTAA